MNSSFYRSLMQTRTFFSIFHSVKYRHVPVARAMFYSCHRRLSRNLEKKKLPAVRRWPEKKRKLYAQFIRPDRVTNLNYRHSKALPGKVIYSPNSAKGMATHRRNSIIVGQSKSEKKIAGRTSSPYCVPIQMGRLNQRAYRSLLKQIYKITRRRNVPKQFKTKSFKRWIAIQLKSVIRMIDGIHQIFAKNRITGVVLHSSVHPLGYLLVHMARQRGVQSFITQYGINDDYQLFSTYAKHYIAWGRYHRSRLTGLGVPGKKFYLLGNARFDPIFSGRWGNKKSLARRLRFAPRKWVFVYPEQPLSLAKNRKVLNGIIRSLRPYRRKVILLVKPHPRQRKMSLTRKQLRSNRHVKIVKNRTIHLYQLIRSSNAVFVQFSTVGIEAILHNRPLISIVFFKNTNKHEFTYYGASRYITSPRNQRQLNRVVKLFMTNSRYRKNILRRQRSYRLGTYTGTLAAKRIKRFISARTK